MSGDVIERMRDAYYNELNRTRSEDKAMKAAARVLLEAIWKHYTANGGHVMTDEARDVLQDVVRQLCQDYGGNIGPSKGADAILAALTAAGFHLHRWQDISEAPKEHGFECVLYFPDDAQHITDAVWHDGRSSRPYGSGCFGFWWTEKEGKPTHFAPLPPAPPDPAP